MTIPFTPEEFKTSYEVANNKGLSQQIEIYRISPAEFHTGFKYDYKWMRYYLSPFPGNCGIVVSNYVWLSEHCRGYGLGEFFHKERLSFMEDMNYSCGMCTTVDGNKPQEAILRNNGWKIVHTFVNKRTNNKCLIWVKDL